MHKRLLAVAVAGALAAPAVAMAQSSVTIAGVFKVGFDSYSISSPGATRTTGVNGSSFHNNEMRVSDQSSAIRFNVVEDISSGLQAVAQLDVRFQPDQGNAGVSSNVIGSGNTWVGLRGNSWGTISLGRFDLHYGKQPDDIASKAGSLMASSNAIMAYAGGGATAIGNATRTQNVIRYDTPNWSGFTLTAAYSTNPGGPEADLNSSASKGYAFNLNPQFASGPWGVGWSTWRSQADAGVQTGFTAAGGFAVPITAPTTQLELTGNIVYGWFSFPFGLKLGLAIDRSSIDTKTLATNTTAASSKRTAFNVPVSYNFGPHTVYFSYSQARNDTATTADDGAKLIALAYNFDLSKRTAVGVTYAKITNDSGATYNFFTNTPAGFGSSGSTLAAGEDASLLSLVLRHAF